MQHDHAVHRPAAERRAEVRVTEQSIRPGESSGGEVCQSVSEEKKRDDDEDEGRRRRRRRGVQSARVVKDSKTKRVVVVVVVVVVVREDMYRC